MQAIILAAGEGSRLRPLTQNRPKALLPVAGKPILGHVIASLHAAEVHDIIVVVGYRSEMVMRYLAQYNDIKVVHQKTQLGTADAVAAALPFVTGDLLILPGDNYISVSSIMDLMHHTNAILVTRSKDSTQYGILTIKEEQIVAIHEKPKHATSMTISCGAYHISHDLCALIPSYGYDITDFLEATLSHVPFTAVYTSEWGDAIWPWHLLGLNDLLLSQIIAVKNGQISSHAVIEGAVYLEPGVKIGPYTHIRGPVYIGHDVTLASHISIGSGCSIGARSYISPFTSVSNSLMMEDVIISEQCCISDSVIGENVRMGASVRMVEGIGALKMPQGELVDTQFGVIVGAGTHIGSCSTLSHTIIGAEADLGIGLNLSSCIIENQVQVR
ncbi:MAG: sugar phosphate nucleotidyltransferase [Euryarchaeota archaeon]|nr:sugar phosphate nucleotidyltransferase [Euryarchaeota archaeon]